VHNVFAIPTRYIYSKAGRCSLNKRADCVLPQGESITHSDVVGKGGGYILNPEVPLIDENPENVKAMTDFFKEHGVYR
jgi:hypothetical protein